MSEVLKSYGIKLSEIEAEKIDALYERLMKIPGYKNPITHAFMAYVFSPLLSLALEDINPLMKEDDILKMRKDANKEVTNRLEKVRERCDKIIKFFKE